MTTNFQTGSSSTPKKMNGCLKVFLIIAVLLFIVPIIYYIVTPREKLAEIAKETAIKDSIARAQKEKDLIPYSCRLRLVEVVKSNMKDPESYEERNIEHYVNSDGTIIVNLTYAGTNSFGGKIQEKVSAKFDNKGNFIEILK